MTAVLTVACALLSSLANAAGTVLQRKAGRAVPESHAFSARLMGDLLRSPAWLAGMAAEICGAALQGLALSLGSLALVQPIFVSELPFALVIGCLVFHRTLPVAGWAAVVSIAAGLALGLAAAAPSGGHTDVEPGLWALALTVGGGASALCVLGALRHPRGKARAFLFGASAAIAYALTAVLMKAAATTFSLHGAGAFFTSWQTYAFAVAGACSLFLVSNAMESGPIVASQPALTLGDALVSLFFGVLLYEEHLRTGWWLLPEAVGAVLVIGGTLVLPRVGADTA
ncbi:hypothetical protein BLA24_11600 [Streptomyces cinnamoneus]|uniref:DMT family transporter n=1 Tax=Streptomyces cinnamoneus TaxID=53446 RepID=A0A2G1XKH1_STRCJ|nr:DMT family transporter [Streptomyces cinnamoneus]PHQ51727.1 hypothetical protein BLA24_11600 [Streptomyces cinnamoneus]PPT11975.1 hypothetical protein CYQ11_02835 [Streptomyces cinnamoneus]